MVGLSGEMCHREVEKWDNVWLENRQLVGQHRRRDVKGPPLAEIARGSVAT